MHIRGTIRAAVRAALAGEVLAGTILKHGSVELSAEDLPATSITTPISSDQRGSVGEAIRVIDIAIMHKRCGGDDLEDDLDAVSVVIEESVLPSLGGLTADAQLERTEISTSLKSEKATGELRMTFRAVVFTDEGNPD